MPINSFESSQYIYIYMRRLQSFYSLLQDDLSRKIFWARLEADVEVSCFSNPQKDGVIRLSSIFIERCNEKFNIDESLEDAIKHHKKIIVYGTRLSGLGIASMMLASGMDFNGFVSRGAERFPSGLMGKPVYSPEWLANNSKDTFVIVAVTNRCNGYNEVTAILDDIGIPQNHIIFFDKVFAYRRCYEQYFEFPELIPRGKAFLDCGCYNGGTSLSFARYCGGNYSKIYAFEPDHENFVRCERTFQNSGLHDVILSDCGLSDKASIVNFLGNANSGSYILPEDEGSSAFGQKPVGDLLNYQDIIQKIETTCIDDTVGEDTVGFIKMDIEGSELSALRGAKNTIIRDKPFLAICVYHKAGDVLAIMDYCQRLVPEYKFWLRQYDAIEETVLYASIRTLNT